MISSLFINMLLLLNLPLKEENPVKLRQGYSTGGIYIGPLWGNLSPSETVP